MLVRFHPDAEAEIEAASAYYDDESPGAGERFEVIVEAAVQLISEYPDLGAPDGPVRRLVLQTYPYTVVYRVQDDLLGIIAVAHHRRRPRYWRKRLRGF